MPNEAREALAAWEAERARNVFGAAPHLSARLDAALVDRVVAG